MPLPIVVANWKMHGSLQMLEAFCREVVPLHVQAERVICPPFPFLLTLHGLLRNSGIAVGAQHCHGEERGAYTGDVSAAMLAECGCRYVILGHSERRAAYDETDMQIAVMANRAIAAGVLPIICVGESLSERESGLAESTVLESVSKLLSGIDSPDAVNELIIAYEPIWAIGTGKTPETGDVEAMHMAIHRCVSEKYPAYAGKLRVLYGGSVKPGNAEALIQIEGVDGFLVGGSSLRSDEFNAICTAAQPQRVAA